MFAVRILNVHQIYLLLGVFNFKKCSQIFNLLLVPKFTKKTLWSQHFTRYLFHQEKMHLHSSKYYQKSALVELIIWYEWRFDVTVSNQKFTSVPFNQTSRLTRHYLNRFSFCWNPSSINPSTLNIFQLYTVVISHNKNFFKLCILYIVYDLINKYTWIRNNSIIEWVLSYVIAMNEHWIHTITRWNLYFPNIKLWFLNFFWKLDHYK